MCIIQQITKKFSITAWLEKLEQGELDAKFRQFAEALGCKDDGKSNWKWYIIDDERSIEMKQKPAAIR